VYGEDYAGGRAAAAEQNLLTRAWKQFDSAGVATNETCDFKGNLLRSSRRLVSDYKTIPDWETYPEPEDRPDDWEEEIFLSSSRYDALNRPIQLVAPHAGSETDVIRPGYNEANLLERLDVWLKHAGEPAELLTPDTADEHFVTNIDYNARGQRTLIQYGNGAETCYHYDPETFRLVHLYTRRGVSYSDDCGDDPTRYPAPDMPPQDTPCGLQNLHYTYDPAGNITSIRDDAQQTIYFNGEVVPPNAEYTYDAIYRLIEANGREHIGQVAQPQTNWNDEFRVNLQHPNNGNAMRNYTEKYEYDGVGNILHFNHYANGGSWIRAYEYDEPSLIELEKKSNRLSCTVVHPNGQHPISEPYTYDPHGNMISMPHLPQMEWDFKDQMQMVDKGGGCMAYYVHDAGGQRVRKVIEQNGMRQKERFYLGGFEVYRKYNGDESIPKLERETLHVMDDKQRIALVETRTQGDDGSLPQLIRYQLGNHLGSASLELDAAAQIISYEEYYPYGSSSYQAVRSDIEVSAKRYRYTGMERDEETGLNYHTARYYAAWLSRWISFDPIAISGGLNGFAYSSQNPVNLTDTFGLSDDDPPPTARRARGGTGSSSDVGAASGRSRGTAAVSPRIRRITARILVGIPIQLSPSAAVETATTAPLEPQITQVRVGTEQSGSPPPPPPPPPSTPPLRTPPPPPPPPSTLRTPQPLRTPLPPPCAQPAPIPSQIPPRLHAWWNRIMRNRDMGAMRRLALANPRPPINFHGDSGIFEITPAMRAAIVPHPPSSLPSSSIGPPESGSVRSSGMLGRAWSAAGRAAGRAVASAGRAVRGLGMTVLPFQVITDPEFMPSVTGRLVIDDRDPNDYNIGDTFFYERHYLIPPAVERYHIRVEERNEIRIFRIIGTETIFTPPEPDYSGA
jgi:RHS repeat-associated protein